MAFKARPKGRPPMLPRQQLRLIETSLEASHFTITSTELVANLNLEVSPRTVRRIKRKMIDQMCKERRYLVSVAASSFTGVHEGNLVPQCCREMCSRE